jgi:hypothetical protein
MSAYWLALMGAAAHADWTNGSLGFVGSDEALGWTIPGPETWGPVAGRCVISELKWDYAAVGLRARLDWLSDRERWFLRMLAQGGWIVDGTACDRDWAGPNRSLEVSHTYSDVSGWSGQARALVGYTWSWDRFAIAPVVGVEAHRAYLKEYGLLTLFQADFTEIQPECCEETGIVLNLNGQMQVCPVAWWANERSQLISTYGADWYGPLMGLALWAYPAWRWDITESPMSWELTAWIGLEQWHADADWCLRPEFAHPLSFTHYSLGTVFGFEDTLRFQLTDSWSLILESGGQFAAFPDGCEDLYYADGDHYKLWVDDTHWKQWWGSIGASYTF